MKLANKKALVTGASKGIGAAIVIALAKEGVSVAINYHKDTKSAKNVLEKCNKHSKDNILVQADITEENDVKKMFSRISDKYKILDFLVNNAGVYDDSKNPNDAQVFNKMYQYNLLAQTRVTEHFLKLTDNGKIVNISSIHGKLGHGNSTAIAYSALKAAFESYTKNLAKALAPKILVNGIAPGRTLTPMWGDLSPKKTKELGEGQLIDRFIAPDELADGVVFLLKNDAVCGEILVIDGGMSLKILG